MSSTFSVRKMIYNIIIIGGFAGTTQVISNTFYNSFVKIWFTLYRKQIKVHFNS